MVFRPPLKLDQPIVEPKLRTMLENFHALNIWIWTAEMEEVYQSASGWEELVEQWWAYYLVWRTDMTVAYEDAMASAKFIQDQFVFFALCRRAFIRLFLNDNLAATIGSLESTRLDNLPRFDQVPSFVPPSGNVVVLPALLKRIDPKLSEAVTQPSAYYDFASLPLPPGKKLPAFSSASRPELLPHDNDFETDNKTPPVLMEFFVDLYSSQVARTARTSLAGGDLRLRLSSGKENRMTEEAES
ncbi:hypothetical protein JCM6882_009522 [Rhodosporidiobolus microsporus]